MPHGSTPNQPLEKQAPLLWTILYLGCLVCGLALATMSMPLQSGVVMLARSAFGIILVLGVVLLALATWRLTAVVRAVAAPRPATWRWAVLLAAVAAGSALGVWSATSQSIEDPVLVRLGTTLLLGLGFGAALGVAMHSLVKIISSRH